MMYNIVLKSSETSKYQLAEGEVFKFTVIQATSVVASSGEELVTMHV